MYYQKVKVEPWERGFHFKNGKLLRILSGGLHRFIGEPEPVTVDIVSMRTPLLKHKKLQMIIDSGLLPEEAQVITLSETQRGLLWTDDNFETVLMPGQHVIWREIVDTRLEIFDTKEPELKHPEIQAIINSGSAYHAIKEYHVSCGFSGVLFLNGNIAGELEPGSHLFWKTDLPLWIEPVDIREHTSIFRESVFSSDNKIFDVVLRITSQVTSPSKTRQDLDCNTLLQVEIRRSTQDIFNALRCDKILEDLPAVAETLREVISQKMEIAGISILDAMFSEVYLSETHNNITRRIDVQKL